MVVEPSIDDYAERTAETIPVWHAMNGQLLVVLRP
jgi:hypothetical protein